MNLKVPLLLPGIYVNTSPNDGYAIGLFEHYVEIGRRKSRSRDGGVKSFAKPAGDAGSGYRHLSGRRPKNG
jgi:hypothetical protein